MFSHVFLAVTGREMAEYLPKRTAYLSCHFSPYGNGLSNLPTVLPPESLLLLDDSMPPDAHCPETVAKELTALIGKFAVKAVLLDFQNPPSKACEKMADFLSRSLPCPVATSQVYASKLGGPVFLSPPPVHVLLQDYLTPWLKQGVYLEIAPETTAITVTERGSSYGQALPAYNLPFKDRKLHCHYRTEVFPDKAVFTLCRYKEDLLSLVEEAEKLGTLGTVGLYQELKDI